MKKYILVLVFLAGVVPVRAQTLSVDDKTAIIAELQTELRDLITQLIAQLKLEIAQQVAVSVPVVPLAGNILNNMPIDIGTIVVNDAGKGTVPLKIETNSYIGGMARVKGETDPSVDWGVSWQQGGTVPDLEGLDAGDYSYVIKLYNRPYNQTNQGRDTDTVAEKTGTFTIPVK